MQLLPGIWQAIERELIYPHCSVLLWLIYYCRAMKFALSHGDPMYIWLWRCVLAMCLADMAAPVYKWDLQAAQSLCTSIGIKILHLCTLHSIPCALDPLFSEDD